MTRKCKHLYRTLSTTHTSYTFVCNDTSFLYPTYVPLEVFNYTAAIKQFVLNLPQGQLPAGGKWPHPNPLPRLLDIHIMSEHSVKTSP